MYDTILIRWKIDREQKDIQRLRGCTFEPLVRRMFERILDSNKMTPSTSETKEELRQKLRAKIRDKRTPTHTNTTSQQLKADPAGALLRMGIDDPSVLAQAAQIVKNPHDMLNKLKQQFGETEEESEDEEAPA